MSTSAPIDFNDYISGEAALLAAAKSVRSLKKDVTDLSKTVGEDAARIKAGFGEIATAIQGIQGKAVKLNLINPEDKKLLADYIQQVGDLRTAQAALKEQEKAGAAIQKTLNEAAKAATSALKEQQVAFKAAADAGDVEAQKKAAAAIQEVKASADQAGRALRGANSEFTAATGSINELRLRLSAGTAAYNALSKAERENSDAGKALQAGNKALSDELKGLEKAIGDTRRNVGNYGEAFRDAANSGVLPFSQSINKAVQVADGLKTGLEAARKGLYGVREGGVVAAEGLNVVKVGLISTGIGAFIVLLASLYEYFTKSDDGAENLAAGLAYLKGVFNVLESVLVTTGRALSLVFTDPKKAASDLVDFLETNLSNRVKAVGLLFESIGKGSYGGLTDAAVQLTTGITNATAKSKAFGDELSRAAGVARELSRAGDQLEDLEIANIARTEKQAQAAARLLLTFKDRNLTEAQRLTNLDEAGRLEKSNLTNNLAIEKERLRITAATNAEATKRGVIQDADRRKEAEQTANLFRLQGEFEQQAQIIANRKSLLQKQERAEDAVAAKAAREKQLEAQRDAVRERQTQIQRELLAVKEGSAEELALKKRDLAAKRDLDLINDKLTANGRALLRETERADEHKADVEFAARKAAAEAKDLEDRKRKATEVQAVVDKAYQTELLGVQNGLKAEQAALETALARGELTRGEYERRLLAAKQQAFNQELALNKKFDKDSADVQKRTADAELEALKKKEAAKAAVLRRGTEQATALVNGYFSYQSAQLNAQGAAEQASYERNLKNAGDNAALKQKIEEAHQKKVAELQRKQAENDRKQALFNIAVSTAQAIAAEIRQFGFLAALPFIAADVALGAVQAATVLAQPIPQFFRGRKGGALVPIASVAERGPELIERAGTGRFEYAAKPTYTSLGAGDSVYTAAETARMLATAGLTREQVMQPGAVAAAFSSAAQEAHAARTGGAEDYGVLSRAVEANTAALGKIKPVVVNVGPGSDASVQTSVGITQYLTQRTFQ